MQLDALLTAHSYLRVERPPELWPVEADDTTLIPLLGLMIAAALVRGTELEDVVLNVNNVTVEPGDHVERPPVPGDYVALTILGEGDWHPEVSWHPGVDGSHLLLAHDLDAAARAAGVPFAYTRVHARGGSVTVFLHRL